MKFNLKKLSTVLKADTNDLLNNPKKYWNFKFQKGKGYLYVDRGASILAVAHMDTVADPDSYYKGNSVFKNRVSIEQVGFDDYDITSIKLDDRLGVFMIMDVLPYLGLRYDILLTTGEEIGLSTARYFETKKNYNWMFELDRRDFGTAVMYQYDSKELRQALQGSSYRIETGSFSDISELDFLGCVGINFGVGYRDEHTDGCYTRTSWMNVVVNMFVDFYSVFKDKKFDYVYTPVTKTGTVTTYRNGVAYSSPYTNSKYSYLKKGQKIGGRISYDSYYDDYYKDYGKSYKDDNWVYDSKTDSWYDITDEVSDVITKKDNKDYDYDFEPVIDSRSQNPQDFLYPGDFDENEDGSITVKNNEKRSAN